MSVPEPRPSRLRQPSPPAGLAPDHVVRWFASRQYDVVAREQLLAAGLTRHQIDGRAARGALRRVHRGVFALAAARLSPEGRFLAAALAHGTGAVVSHRSAAVLWGALPDAPGPVHVTVDGRRPSRPGVTVHRSDSLPAAATVRHGIPCTRPARTLVDVAASEGSRAARRAWTTLAARRVLRVAAVSTELERHPDRPGSAVVRRLLDRHATTVAGRTRSDLEIAALAMCAEGGLPPPTPNGLVEVGGEVYEVDLLWAAARLVVELDDFSTHGHPDAFREDRLRDRALTLAGWTVARLVWEDVTTHAAASRRDLRRLLERRSG